MSTYELLLVLPGTLDEGAAATRASEIEKMVAEHGTEVSVKDLGKNRLAYPVKQIRYGYFYTLMFKAETAAVATLQKKLSLLRDILRAMVTHFNVQVSNAAMAPATFLAGEDRRLAREERLLAEEKGIADRAEKAAVAVEEDAVEMVKEKSAPIVTEKPADLKEIDRKLDEILDNDVMAGV